MTRRHLLFAAVCLTFSACSRSNPVSESRSAAGIEPAAATAGLEDYVIAGPFQHGNLTIFPILSKSPRLEDRFMTLEEGLKARTVEILEMGARSQAVRQRQDSDPFGGDADAGASNQAVPQQQAVEQTAARQADFGQSNDEGVATNAEAAISQQFAAGNEVNRLMVINRGDKPLYLMPGEIIVGGSQDRTIAEETVIAATGKPVPIDVYCVEHGRWGARDAATVTAVLQEVAADSSSTDDLAGESNQGKFVAKAGTLSTASRLTVQAGEGQERVWDAVEKTNQTSGAKWSSGAFTANYVDQEVVDRLKPYVDALSRQVSDQEQVVGVVVAVNGKIETVDVFESTPLFRKLWPQLLKSFALDALEVRDADDAGKPGTLREAQTFLSGVLHDHKAEGQKTDGGLVVSRRETKDAVSFSGVLGGNVGGGMGGGFGGAIHAAGFAK